MTRGRAGTSAPEPPPVVPSLDVPAARPGTPAIDAGAGPRTARTPSVSVPLRYLVAAAVAFGLAALGVVALARELSGHYYQPRLLALTHTVTLGWVTLTILGASYQLVPVVLGRPLWSERLARWQFVALLAGLVGMIGHFFIGDGPGLVWAAGLVVLALLAHVVNVARTVRGMTTWTFTARLVVVGHAGLVLTALSGLALGLDHARPFLPGDRLGALHAHVHAALLGWVLPMVIGIAARVYPMFLLAREPGGWLGTLQLTGVVAGVPAVVVGLAVGWPPLVRAGALAVTLAIAAHLAWIVDAVRARRRPAAVWPLRFVLGGAVFLASATLVGLGLAFGALAGPRVASAYLLLALGGWASLTIAGMMLKIVRFLVWYRAWGPRVGRGPVPTLDALGAPRVEAAAFTLLVTGVAAAALAVAAGNVDAIRAAGAVVAAGAGLFAVALGAVLVHLVRARGGSTPARPHAERPS